MGLSFRPAHLCLTSPSTISVLSMESLGLHMICFRCSHSSPCFRCFIALQWRVCNRVSTGIVYTVLDNRFLSFMEWFWTIYMVFYEWWGAEVIMNFFPNNCMDKWSDLKKLSSLALGFQISCSEFIGYYFSCLSVMVIAVIYTVMMDVHRHYVILIFLKHLSFRQKWLHIKTVKPDGFEFQKTSRCLE